MNRNQILQQLKADIDAFRAKAKYYTALHLFEAAKYAEHLAANLELALTTLPSDDDIEIS